MIVIHKGGRPRKTNVVRDESGKSRGERFDPTPIMNQPHRRAYIGVRFDDKDNDVCSTGDAGYPLGRLEMCGLITKEQRDAGNNFAIAVTNYAKMMGIPMGSPRSGALLSMQGGGFYRWEGDEANIDPEESKKRLVAVRSRYNDCHDALGSLGRVHRRGHKILHVMREICVAEIEETSLWADQEKLGDLRLGLNAVAKIFKMEEKR